MQSHRHGGRCGTICSWQPAKILDFKYLLVRRAATSLSIAQSSLYLQGEPFVNVMQVAGTVASCGY